MTDSDAHSGKCLCGAVSITTGPFREGLDACHCGMCKKWGGGPYMSVNCGTDVAVDGNEHVTVFNSSEWAERGFCSQCGTHLFYRLKGNGHYAMPVGFFDDKPRVSFDSQIFIDEKPAYYSFADKTTNMTGAEVFAKYAPAE